MAGEIGAEADRNWYSMGGAETRLKEAVMKLNRLSESTNEQTKADKRDHRQARSKWVTDANPCIWIVCASDSSDLVSRPIEARFSTRIWLAWRWSESNRKENYLCGQATEPLPAPVDCPSLENAIMKGVYDVADDDLQILLKGFHNFKNVGLPFTPPVSMIRQRTS